MEGGPIIRRRLWNGGKWAEEKIALFCKNLITRLCAIHHRRADYPSRTYEMTIGEGEGSDKFKHELVYIPSR